MRKELSFTQKQMAQKIAVTEYQYRKYEQGIDFLPLHIANRWMFFTGATIQSLFSNELDGILGDENNKHVYVFSYFCSRLSAERFKSLLILLFGINEAGYSQNYSDLDVGIDAGQFNFSNVAEVGNDIR